MRRVVVVGPHDEDTRALHQRLHRPHQRRRGIHRREVVAGVDHEVRLERIQTADPFDLALLTGHEVQVGELEHPEGGRRPAGRGRRSGAA